MGKIYKVNISPYANPIGSIYNPYENYGNCFQAIKEKYPSCKNEDVKAYSTTRYRTSDRKKGIVRIDTCRAEYLDIELYYEEEITFSQVRVNNLEP